MIHYYCPNCWRDFETDFENCPDCGANVKHLWESRDIVEKLILSLHHPDSQTAMRAAWLLGEIRDIRSVGPLMDLIKETSDIYMARAAVIALGKIGSDDALAFLESMADNQVAMVRDEIKNIIPNRQAAKRGEKHDSQNNDG